MDARKGRWTARFLCLALFATLACGPETAGPSDCGQPAGIALEPAGTLTLIRLMGVGLVRADIRSECGTPLTPGELALSSSAPSVASVEPVQNAQRPTLLIRARSFGTATVSVGAGDARAELTVEVRQPETEASAFSVLGSGDIAHSTTDLWVHGDYAYTGSSPWVCPGGSCVGLTGWLYVWRLLPGGGIEKVDSVAMPAPRINDVKVSADGAFAVASLELGGPSNGIVVLDLSDPASPTMVSHYTSQLDGGVHNLWIERIDGTDYAFVVVAIGDHQGVHILDLSNRAVPVDVALFYGGSSVVHDVYVRDGLAFLSHWDAGLVILDVGNGIMGGGPDNPIEVGRVQTQGGNTHNAWYWPERALVFVGEEQFPPPERSDEVGVMHVVDVSDLTRPVEVATYGVPGVTPHNFWLDEDRDILFAGWYEAGLRAIDVTGELSGDLSAQGRELGSVLPSGERGGPSIWAPQIHDGLIYLSDIYNGIWAVRFDG